MATAVDPDVRTLPTSVLSRAGYEALLDADVALSCVDRPWPRHLLNSVAYAHLIPVVDGGILAVVDGEDFVHADWRIHTIGAEQGCLVCTGALLPEDVSLDIAGRLDDPDYIKNLPPEKRRALSRRNVFPFSMSVAAHEVLQFVGCVTGLDRVGGIGPQAYRCFPGEMAVVARTCCDSECGYAALTATAADMTGNLDPEAEPGDAGTSPTKAPMSSPSSRENVPGRKVGPRLTRSG